MGIRLMIEALYGAPACLTHRERQVLTVLCEDASDSTRQTWSSVEAPEVLQRAHVSRSQMHEVLRSLIKKEVLERVGRGQKHRTAKYKIRALSVPESLILSRLQRPENRDAEHGVSVPKTGTLNSQRPENPDPETHPQHPENRDTEKPQRPENPDAERSQHPENRDAYLQAGKQAGKHPHRERQYRRIPDWAQPTIDSLEAKGIVVSWQRGMSDLRWVQFQQLLRSHGQTYLVHIAGLRWNADNPIKFGTLLLEIWQEYPAPKPGSPWHANGSAARDSPNSETPPLPEWCGHCDQADRRIERDGRAYRCPNCHPDLAGART